MFALQVYRINVIREPWCRLRTTMTTVLGPHRATCRSVSTLKAGTYWNDGCRAPYLKTIVFSKSCASNIVRENKTNGDSRKNYNNVEKYQFLISVFVEHPIKKIGEKTPRRPVADVSVRRAIVLGIKFKLSYYLGCTRRTSLRSGKHFWTTKKKETRKYAHWTRPYAATR